MYICSLESAEDIAQRVKDACGGGVDGCVDFANTAHTVATVVYAGNKVNHLSQLTSTFSDSSTCPTDRAIFYCWCWSMIA